MGSLVRLPAPFVRFRPGCGAKPLRGIEETLARFGTGFERLAGADISATLFGQSMMYGARSVSKRGLGIRVWGD